MTIGRPRASETSTTTDSNRVWACAARSSAPVVYQARERRPFSSRRCRSSS